ncbi:hypothetical protein [Rhizobium sp.]
MNLYWLVFDVTPDEMLFRMGCGITAISEDDAWRIAMGNDSIKGASSRIKSLKAIKLEQIDPSHILPNAGNMAIRGIWFPNGI